MKTLPIYIYIYRQEVYLRIRKKDVDTLSTNRQFVEFMLYNLFYVKSYFFPLFFFTIKCDVNISTVLSTCINWNPLMSILVLVQENLTINILQSDIICCLVLYWNSLRRKLPKKTQKQSSSCHFV